MTTLESLRVTCHYSDLDIHQHPNVRFTLHCIGVLSSMSYNYTAVEKLKIASACVRLGSLEIAKKKKKKKKKKKRQLVP